MRLLDRQHPCQIIKLSCLNNALLPRTEYIHAIHCSKHRIIQHPAPDDTMEQPSRAPPPPYQEEPPSSEEGLLHPPTVVTGEPIVPTAVPLHDVENAEASASRGQKGMSPPGGDNAATQGVVVGPTVGDLPSAFAVEMTPMQPQLAHGGRVDDGELRYPQQSVVDAAMPEVGWLLLAASTFFFFFMPKVSV